MVTPISLCSLITVTFVSFLLLFSLFSLSFIFHFNLKTFHSHHLRDFNALSSVRILLVSFASLWSLSQLLRLPLFSPSPSPIFIFISPQTVCKLYIVSSLGLFQPCFFITLLFLLNISLSRDTPSDHTNTTLSRALLVVSLSSLPTFLSQLFFLFLAPRLWKPLEPFSRQFVVVAPKAVQCTYPLIATAILGVFGALYVVCFVGVCWRAVALVINKKLRVRICGLAFAVVSSISAQFLALALSVIWRPGELPFEALSLLAFLSVLSCALVGEGIFVVQPLADALIVDGAFLDSPSSSSESSSSPALIRRRSISC